MGKKSLFLLALFISGTLCEEDGEKSEGEEQAAPLPVFRSRGAFFNSRGANRVSPLGNLRSSGFGGVRPLVIQSRLNQAQARNEAAEVETAEDVQIRTGEAPPKDEIPTGSKAETGRIPLEAKVQLEEELVTSIRGQVIKAFEESQDETVKLRRIPRPGSKARAEPAKPRRVVPSKAGSKAADIRPLSADIPSSRNPEEADGQTSINSKARITNKSPENTRTRGSVNRSRVVPLALLNRRPVQGRRQPTKPVVGEPRSKQPVAEEPGLKPASPRVVSPPRPVEAVEDIEENGSYDERVESINQQIERLLLERAKLEGNSNEVEENLVELEETKTAPLRPIPTNERKTKPVNTKPAVLSPRHFFNGQEQGILASSVRVIPLPRENAQPQAGSRVNLDGFEVPKFSKMVKNHGVHLREQDDSFTPVEDLEEVVQLEQKLEVPTSEVQGFRVQGDRSNRVIFLNVAALGYDSSRGGLLKFGDSVLVPIEQDDFEDPAQLNLDANHKMVSTNRLHPNNVHQRVNLPEFRSVDRLVQLTRAKANQVQLSRARNNQLQADQTQSRTGRLLKPSPSQAVNQAHPRAKPIQFFSRFGGLLENGPKEVSGPELVPVDAQLPLPVARNRPSGRTQDIGFSNFPRDEQSLPGRPLPRVAQQPAKNQDEFTSYLNGIDENARLNQQEVDRNQQFSSFLSQQNQAPRDQQRLRAPQQQGQFQNLQQQDQGRFQNLQQQQDQGRFQNLQQQSQFQNLQQNRVEEVNGIPDQVAEVPGVDEVLRQQAELRALQLEHSQYNDKLNSQNPEFLKQQQLQQSRQRSQQQQHQSRQHQQLEQSRQQQLQQQQQPRQQQQQVSQQIPGLEQHARYVSELQAAQDALRGLA
eukprot:TRINITY_DN62_c0_g1_i9.p1 TRINITY_DN62_c0_g1~~TRINITY_DN62_c0_g1_i9.p1  ORF type:complete len:870 (-),score=216.01 TRINITY_DN62_c0_g1_i9:93-2702(-)